MEVEPNVKIPTSTNYRDRLIESLQDPISQRERFANEAAAYLEVTLERDLEDPIPELLRSILSNMVAAKERVGELSATTKDLHSSLDRVLAESKGVEIYGLIDLLDALGFRLAVVPKDE